MFNSWFTDLQLFCEHLKEFLTYSLTSLTSLMWTNDTLRGKYNTPVYETYGKHQYDSVKTQICVYLDQRWISSEDQIAAVKGSESVQRRMQKKKKKKEEFRSDSQI